MNRLLFIAYGASGLCAAIAGLIVAGRVGIVDTSLGLDFEFTVITAVVLGGTSLFGGRGSILGSVVGAVLLSTIDNGLNLIGANPFIYAVVRGLILMVAISLDAFANRGRAGQLAGEMS
jgi:ribose/xylose/arabinose/galactoside ABC-type transport system permease subunit